VPQPGNPQALNRYAYVLNNPLKYTDPSGRKYDPYGDDFGPDIEWDPKKQTEFDKRVAQEYALAYRDIVTKGETPMNWQKYIITNPESPWYGDSIKYDPSRIIPDAVGVRVEVTIFGSDLNIDYLFNRRSGQHDIFVSMSGEQGTTVVSGGGGGGILLAWGMPDNGGYGGMSNTYGVTCAPIPSLPAIPGAESDLTVSPVYKGETPVTWYVGLAGGLQYGFYRSQGGTQQLVGYDSNRGWNGPIVDVVRDVVRGAIQLLADVL